MAPRKLPSTKQQESFNDMRSQANKTAAQKLNAKKQLDNAIKARNAARKALDAHKARIPISGSSQQFQEIGKRSEELQKKLAAAEGRLKDLNYEDPSDASDNSDSSNGDDDFNPEDHDSLILFQ